jgi:hypothetical protein
VASQSQIGGLVRSAALSGNNMLHVVYSWRLLAWRGTRSRVSEAVTGGGGKSACAEPSA